MAALVEVRSFRRVYRLERRIYTIANGRGHWRIPVPGGVPVWGAVYFAAAFAALLVARALPGLGVVIAALPAALCLTLGPGAIALVGARYRPYGRMPHRHWCSLVAERCAGRVFAGERPLPRAAERAWSEEPVTIAPGVDWPELIDAWVRGPAIVRVRDGGVARVGAGERLRIRPAGTGR